MNGDSGFAKVEHSLRMQSIVMTMARVLRTILTIAIPVVMVRVLDQETFGAYKQIGLIASAALAILSLGLPPSLYYFVPRLPEKSQIFVVQTAIVFAVVGIIGGVALVLGDSLLARAFGPQLARYSLWLGAMVALSITALLDIAMVVDRRVRLAAVSSAVLDATHGLLVVAAALITRDLHWIMAAAILSLILRVIVLVGYIRWRGRAMPTTGRTRGALIEQFQYALPYYGASLIALAGEQFHAFYVATVYDAAQFAIYAIGTLQLPMIGHLMHSIGETIVLDGSKKYADGNVQEMHRVWRRATYMLALILMPLFFVLEVFARDVIEVFFGIGYSASAEVFRIFIITLPLSILLGSTLLRATADLRLMMVANTIGLTVGAISLVLMVDRFGVTAAAWSVVLGNLALTAVVTGKILKRLESTLGEYLEWRGVGAVILTALGCAVLSYYATWPLPQWLRVFVGPALAVLLYLALVWILRLIPESERKAVLNVWSQARAYRLRA